jgi:ArsR family transcriptional regulator
MEKIAQSLRLLGDETRLRILRLLARHSLNVSELTEILGLAQSGVSRHLSHLRKMGLLQERRDGVWTYYQLTSLEHADPELRLLGQYLQQQLAELTDSTHDEVRLQEVLHRRRLGGPGLNERLLELGQSWFAWSRLLGQLIGELNTGLTIADLGCGDGTLTLEMSRFAEHVIGVDRDPELLQEVQRNLQAQGRTNIELRHEQVESLSIADACVDLVMFSQSLHHLQHPQLGLQQAFRICKTGGRVLIAELAAHQEEWVQAKLGHAWLGFSEQDLRQMLEQAGWQIVTQEVLPASRERLFQVMLAVGRKM